MHLPLQVSRIGGRYPTSECAAKRRFSIPTGFGRAFARGSVRGFFSWSGLISD